MVDITPRHHKIDSKDGCNVADDHMKIGTDGTDHTLYRPYGLSLPTNHDFNSFLASHQLTNKYLVTMVVKCATVCESMCS